MKERGGKLIFSDEWRRYFIDVWNSPKNAKAQSALAGAGTVIFVTTSGSLPSAAALHWDSEGRVGNADDNPAAPRFEAQEAIWEAFVDGRISAVGAVITGKIKFHGPSTFALRFGPEFDYVSKVLRAQDTDSA